MATGDLEASVHAASETIKKLLGAVEGVVIGQRAMVERLVLGLMVGKDEEKVQLTDLDDIYSHADKLKATVSAYLA